VPLGPDPGRLREELSLVPLGEARLGRLDLNEWLRRSHKSLILHPRVLIQRRLDERLVSNQ
jgi:hypothetical protein